MNEQKPEERRNDERYATDERRGEARPRTLKSAKIIFNLRFSVIDCTVRNMSPHGAKLIVGTQLGIPETFDLEFEGGAARACKVRWRKEPEIGVAFV
jgi:hypothetical protein